MQTVSYVTVEPHSKAAIFVHLLCQVPTTLRLEEDEAAPLSLEIFVDCRMLRNLQHVIRLRGSLRLPQMEIAPARLLFSGRAARREEPPGAPGDARPEYDIVFDSQNDKQITLKNQARPSHSLRREARLTFL